MCAQSGIILQNAYLLVCVAHRAKRGAKREIAYYRKGEAVNSDAVCIQHSGYIGRCNKRHYYCQKLIAGIE